jgi:hypothetical protein
MTTRNAALVLVGLLSSTRAFAEGDSDPGRREQTPRPGLAASEPSAAAEQGVPGGPATRGAAPAVPTPETRPEASPSGEPQAAGWYRIRPVLELGFLGVLKHDLQFGRDGTYWDLARDAGQDNLFFVWRGSVEAQLWRSHTLIFLYQPLVLDTAVQLKSDLVVDDTTFAAGTPVRLSYGFPFYRLSYLYDFLDDDRRELAIGASVQLRNATIVYQSGDGAVLKSYRNIGVVPLLKARGRYEFASGVFAGVEIDGIYAPISVINGSDNEVVGALLDASVRLGVKLPSRTEAFLNLRYLGGGAVGQSDPEPFKDGYTKNWLHFLTVSLGASFSPP